MQKPKISIVIPSYNRAEFLPMTLDSILNQSFKEFEIIFVDDGSTDNTEEVMRSYYDKDPRVRYFKQINSERAIARSYGISLSESEYIALTDSDDIWHPDKLEKQLAIMNTHKDVVLCYASVNRIDSKGRKIKAAKRQLEGYSGYVFFDLLQRNFIPSVTPLIRREALMKTGDQVTEYIPYEDWDYWLRLSRLGKFHHIKEPLGDYRIHQQQSVQNLNPEKIEEVTIKILNANTDLKKIDLHKYLTLISKHSSHENSTDDTEKPSNNSKCWTENDFKAIVDKAYSLAYLRTAYWHIVANRNQTAREKLKKSMEYSSKRCFDYRWSGLCAVSYLRPITGKLLKNFLGSLH